MVVFLFIPAKAWCCIEDGRRLKEYVNLLSQLAAAEPEIRHFFWYEDANPTIIAAGDVARRVVSGEDIANDLQQTAALILQETSVSSEELAAKIRAMEKLALSDLRHRLRNTTFQSYQYQQTIHLSYGYNIWHFVYLSPRCNIRFEYGQAS